MTGERNGEIWRERKREREGGRERERVKRYRYVFWGREGREGGRFYSENFFCPAFFFPPSEGPRRINLG